MLRKIFNSVILVIIFLNGLLFIATSIYAFGDKGLSLRIHEDIPPTASDFIIQLKVIICLVVGILYVIFSYSIFKKKHNLALSGFSSFILFDGFYMVEFYLWLKTHPDVLTGFLFFGTLNLLIGIYSLYLWKIELLPNKKLELTG
jgi:hypothetical protein